MEAEQKKIIERNLVIIKTDTCDVDNIVDHLIQMGTFSLEQREKILVPNATSKDNCQRLIDYLIKAGPTAYENFIVALGKTGNKHVIDQMDQKTKDPNTNTYVTTNRNKAELKLDISTGKNQTNASRTQDGREESDDKLWNAITTLKEEVKRNRQIMKEIRNSQQKLEERGTRLHSEYRGIKGQLDSIKKKLSKKDKENGKLKTSLVELEKKLQNVTKEREKIDEEKTNVKEVYVNNERTLKKRETELQLLKETKMYQIENTDNSAIKKLVQSTLLSFI